MAEGPIPWMAIDAYASRHQMNEDDYDRFFALIRALDAEYLRYRERKRKTKGNK